MMFLVGQHDALPKCWLDDGTTCINIDPTVGQCIDTNRLANAVLLLSQGRRR